MPADLELKEAANLLRQPAERADILRLELLHRHGGVYLDADFECLQPIDPLLEGVDCFLGLLDSGRVSNAVIGAVPGHGLLAKAMAEVQPRTTYGPVDREGTGAACCSSGSGTRSTASPSSSRTSSTRPSASRRNTRFTCRRVRGRTRPGCAATSPRAERDRAIAREELRKLQKRYDRVEKGGWLRRILGRPGVQ